MHGKKTLELHAGHVVKINSIVSKKEIILDILFLSREAEQKCVVLAPVVWSLA